MMEICDLTLIIPVYNEEENVPVLHEQLLQVLRSLNKSWEIIYVNDGSTDKTEETLSKLTDESGHEASEANAPSPLGKIKVLTFTRNFGQTAALAAGFNHAAGKTIVTLDCDLQNDPKDIPHLLTKIEEGNDVVCGWRKDRKDPFWSRRLPSKIANRIIAWFTHIPLHDFGCSLKAYRKEIIKEIPLYGEMHRLIPIYAVWNGAKVSELVVQHHPRKYGVSKVASNRTIHVILDVVTAKFLTQYLPKPAYLMGSVSLVIGFAALFFSGWVLFEKFYFGVWAHRNPKLLLSIFLGILSAQFLVFGLLAELMVRIYFQVQRFKPYRIKQKNG